MNHHATRIADHPMPEYTDIELKAIKDVRNLLYRREKAHVGFWAYQNGGADIFTALTRAIREYTYLHQVNKIIAEKKESIASELKNTNTAVLIGAAHAVADKELPILMEMLKQNPDALKKIVLIDVSKSFNEAAAGIVREAVLKINPEIAIEIINKDIFKLTDQDLSVCQDGEVTAFAMGGLPFNSPGDVSHGLPRGQITDFYNQISKIIGFGPHPERNAFVLDFKKPLEEVTDMTKEYTTKPTLADVPEVFVEDGLVNGIEVNKANFEYFFLNCFAYMLKHIPNFAQLNPKLVDRDGNVTPESLMPYIGHYNMFDENSSNMVNGIRVKDKITIKLPDENGNISSITLNHKDSFVMFNTIYPESDFLDGIMRDADTPMKNTASFTAANFDTPNCVAVNRPALVAA